MEVRIYVVGASSDPEKVMCVVPFEVNNSLIFFGPCKKRLRQEFRDRFLCHGRDYAEPESDIFMVGVNAANGDSIRKIVWAGKVKSVMTFSHASRELTGKSYQKMRSLASSPLHVEPLFQHDRLAGYRHISDEHIEGDAWITDFVQRGKPGYLHLKEKRTLLLTGDNGFPLDCCFLCENLFFAKGKGLKVSDTMLHILMKAQPSKKHIDPYAIFGRDKRRAVAGLRGTDLKLDGQLALHFNAGEGSKIDAELNRIRSQIKSLVRLAEEGVQVEEIAQRIRQLEAERKGFEQLIRRLENTSDTEAAITQIAKASEAYFQEFDRKFDTLPISKRKALLQKIVEKIDIDRKTRIAKCHLRKPPRISATRHSMSSEHRFCVCPQPDSNRCYKLEKLVS